MTIQTFDAIIIGAGMGGLGAAAYLAQAGKRVLVLEHYVVPGGYVHEFTRGYYSFDVSLRALGGVAPGSFTYPLLDELGLLQAVQFKRIDPLFTFEYPHHTVTVPADYLAYEDMLIHLFPAEASGIRALNNAMLHVYQDMRRYVLDGEHDRRPRSEPITETYPALFAATHLTWQAYMDNYIHLPELQTIISTTWNYTALPPAQLSAAVFMLRWVNLHVFGGYYPTDGVMTMSWSLARRIKEHGGTILYRQTVNKIDIRDGIAVSVETEKGFRAEANLIISNANPHDTMLHLIGRNHLPNDYAASIDALTPAASNIIVYLALESDLHEQGWKHHEYFTSKQYDCNTAYQAAMAGNINDADMAITYYNRYYPACAPRGGSVVSLYSLASWDYANQWGTGGNLQRYQHNEAYIALKDQMVDAMLTRAEAYIPTIRSAMVYHEVATPLTNMRYSLNPGGSFTGSEMTVDNTFNARLQSITPIPNVWLSSAWTSSFGVGHVLLGSKQVARHALDYLQA